MSETDVQFSRDTDVTIQKDKEKDEILSGFILERAGEERAETCFFPLNESSADAIHSKECCEEKEQEEG